MTWQVFLNVAGVDCKNVSDLFSVDNGTLTTLLENQTWNFMLVRGDRKLTVSVVGSRMINYVADAPITVENHQAIIQAVAYSDKDENVYNKMFNAGE
ncbi:hypothetical protein [uncultured Bacteroides sp.]|uniref:hypothetical protein n=1 Tax=uncultured Bacteroides sp. TaxID=162156 RepID=UPI002AA62140|nr:hypothetical protein [uncultured Bacteroides sp.]